MLTRKLSQDIAELRGQFHAFTSQWTALDARRSTFAPVFIATFKRWRKETGRTFVAFVHEVDPSVPADKDQYMRHRSFQAALYLRRLVEAPETVTGKGRKTLSPYRMLVATIRALLLFYPRPADEVWSAVAKMSHWQDRDLEKLRLAVTKARPLVTLPSAPRLVKRRRVA